MPDDDHRSSCKGKEFLLTGMKSMDEESCTICKLQPSIQPETLQPLSLRTDGNIVVAGFVCPKKKPKKQNSTSPGLHR